MKYLLLLLLISCSSETEHYCSVSQIAEGTLVQCPDGTESLVPNPIQGPVGAPGSNGQDGMNSYASIQPGALCDVYDLLSWTSNPSLPTLFVGSSLKGSFILNNFSIGDTQSSLGFPGMPANLQALVGLEGYSLDCNGYLNVPTSGNYTFKLFSDDGSRLLIEDHVVIENQGLHAPTSVSGSITLNKGLNRINVVYYQGPHTQIALRLKWLGPNINEQVVPLANFVHLQP